MNIAVIGGGVVGLSAAVRLREAGHTVTIFSADPPAQTTSARAGAVFTPYADDAHRRWFADSVTAYRELSRSAPHSGVRFAMMREFFRAPLERLPWWAEVVDAPQRVPIACGGEFVAAFEALVPHIDMTRYLEWLHEHAVSHSGVAWESRTVASFAEIPDRFETIVNCSGLGARRLAPDALVRPIRGQVVHVRNDIGLDRSLLAEIEGGVGTYLFAFADHIVLGGTYEFDEQQAVTIPAVLEQIVRRCRELLRADGHPRWRELGTEPTATAASGESRAAVENASWLRKVAGLRPARIIRGSIECVRVESEQIAGRRVTHNYGHGRAGVTLSWGCAAEVVRQVGQPGK